MASRRPFTASSRDVELPARGDRGSLALVSDIHANLPALLAAEHELERRGIEDVLCLGDVAATGPHPHEVVERLRELGWPVIAGNADAWLLDPQPPEEDETPFARQVRELDLWCAERLTPEDRVWLRSLPSTVAVDLGPRLRLLAFHGSPRSFNELWLATTPDADLDEGLQGVDANVLAGGHSHQALLRRHRDRLLLNPGSVGIPFERVGEGAITLTPARAELAVLRWDGPSLEVAFVQVPLDNRAIIDAYRVSGMPHAGTFTEGRRAALERSGLS